jgi:hypothetical protein
MLSTTLVQSDVAVDLRSMVEDVVVPSIALIADDVVVEVLSSKVLVAEEVVVGKGSMMDDVVVLSTISVVLLSEEATDGEVVVT